jgi:hypothetical protein
MMANLLIHPGPLILFAAHAHYKLEKSAIAKGANQICCIGSIQEMARSKTLKPLANCISITSNCAASDPRDQIFALNKLVKWSERPLPIDYKMTVEDVYANTTRYLLDQGSRFTLLVAGIGFQHQTPNLRSWVPDFSLLPVCNVFEFSIFANNKYNAGGHGGPRVQLSLDSANLAAQVIFVSKISCITPSFMSNDADTLFSEKRKNEERQFFKEAWTLADKMPSRYRRTGQSTEEAFWRTIIEDRQRVENVESPWERQYKRPASAELGICFSVYREGLMRGGSVDATSKRMDDLNAETQFSSTFDYARLFTTACGGRKFAVTESGLMGIVPPLTKIGDHLCLILGFEMPMLLREDTGCTGKGEYQLVGACYIHGIMDGEMLGNEPCIQTVVIN